MKKTKTERIDRFYIAKADPGVTLAELVQKASSLGFVCLPLFIKTVEVKKSRPTQPRRKKSI